MAGALLTSLYTFRMVFLTFFGDSKGTASRKPGVAMKFPLLVLAVLSVIGGFVELSGTPDNRPIFSEFMKTALPSAKTLHDGLLGEGMQQMIASAVSLIGIYLAYLLFLRFPLAAGRLASHPASRALHRFWISGWGFDWLYDKVLVRPFLMIARTNREDFVDLIYGGLAWYSRFFHDTLSLTQSGKVRWYAMGITIGAVITIGIAVFL